MPWPKGVSPTPEMTAKRVASLQRSGRRRVRPILRDGVVHWPCPTCARALPADAFYTKKSRWNGLSNQCRECHTDGSIRTRDPERTRIARRQSMRRSRARHLEEHRARDRARVRPYDEKVKARNTLNRAVRSGKITRPASCTECGDIGKVAAHHPDYAKPLAVIWLCYLCHAEEHRR